NCASEVGTRTRPHVKRSVGRGAERWPGRRREGASLGHFNLLFREARAMPPDSFVRRHETENQDANDQSARTEGPRARRVEKQGAGAPAEPAEARSLHPRLHDDAEEAELGAAQG